MTNKSIFVPGRLCLFGEHSDWAGGYRRIDESITPGYCLAIGTGQGITATVSRSNDFVLRSVNVNTFQSMHLPSYKLTVKTSATIGI